MTSKNRFGFGVTGIFGFMTILPNVMMSDSGTKETMIASSIGLTSSILLISSGCIGLLNKYLPLTYAVNLRKLGVITQLCAFITPSIYKYLDKTEED